MKRFSLELGLPMESYTWNNADILQHFKRKAMDQAFYYFASCVLSEKRKISTSSSSSWSLFRQVSFQTAKRILWRQLLKMAFNFQIRNPSRIGCTRNLDNIFDLAEDPNFWSRPGTIGGSHICFTLYTAYKSRRKCEALGFGRLRQVKFP